MERKILIVGFCFFLLAVLGAGLWQVGSRSPRHPAPPVIKAESTTTPSVAAPLELPGGPTTAPARVKTSQCRAEVLGKTIDTSCFAADIKLPWDKVQAAAVERDAQADCRERNAALGLISTNSDVPCVELSTVVEKLKRGTFKFNKPSKATLEEPFLLRVVLITQEGQEADFKGLPGSVETRPDRPFAQSLEATLTGDDFSISPAGAQARTATLAHPVEWEWKVTPTADGTKTVTIDVAANIQIGADKHRVQLATLHESIEIKVTAFQRVKSYMASANGMITAIAAALTSLAGLVSLVPKARKLFRDYVLTLFRQKRRANRTRARL